MKMYKRKLDEQAVRAAYPIHDRVPGWFFRLTEISNGVWKVDGTDLFGRVVSATGIDERRLLEDCIASASGIRFQVEQQLRD